MIEDYEQRLDELGRRQTSASEKYYVARVEYARLHAFFNFEVAKKLHIYREKKSNLGIDMAMLWMIADAQSSNNTELLKKYEDYQICQAQYKALERALEAMHAEQISIQAIMKYKLTGEMFGG
jgi:hypothetical protein